VAIRPIVRFPDFRLRQKAEPIGDIDEDVRALARDLAETMHAAPGIGITAPHIGVLRRLVVIQLESDREPHIYIDPDIVWSSSDMIRHVEGLMAVCLQHETDQLDGIFWIDRLSKLKRDRLIKRFEKLQRIRA
jgi:peptide deformylase